MTRHNQFSYWILFIIWPFLAFALALRKGFNKSYQPIILAFSFLYGYGVYLYSGDILRYQETYSIVATYDWQDFWYLLSNKLDTKALELYPANSVNRKPDIFALCLSFLTSRISESPRLFWGLVSLIYTWFMLLFFNAVYKHLKIGIKKRWHYVIILFLIMIIPKYVGVTGIRFWPALFLFMYFFMIYIDNGKKIKFIAGAALSILFHYSFFVPVLFLIVSHFLPFKSISIKILVLSSLIFFFLSSTTTIFSYLSKAVDASDETVIGQSAEGYANQDLYTQRLEKKSQKNWYVLFRSESILYILLFATLFEFIGLAKLKETKFTQDMYPYLIVFFCLTLLTYYLGSIGRFKNVFYLLALSRYAIIFPTNHNNRFMKSLVILLAPTLLIYTVVTFRAELYYVEAMTPISNSITMFCVRSSESLSEFLVGH